MGACSRNPDPLPPERGGGFPGRGRDGGDTNFVPFAPPCYGGGGREGEAPDPRSPRGGRAGEVGYAAFIGRFAYAEGINM
jgi:hypothetical protein